MDRPSPLSAAASAARGGGGGGREDCWSEGATEALIEAWGGRYAQLNRGILRQKDWREVAEAVNARRDGGKPPKTDAQCKNRIDTLKKKYKLEKSKPVPSRWPFFSRLDSLVGANPAAKKPSTLTFTLKSSKSRSNPVPVGVSGSESSESSVDGVDDDDDDEVGFDRRDAVKKHRSEIVGSSDGSACRELARAILKFGEVYQRTEISKQQQVMELERQRMEFTRDLELQRMNMFMDTQLELEKVKSQKSAPGSGKKV